MKNLMKNSKRECLKVARLSMFLVLTVFNVSMAQEQRPADELQRVETVENKPLVMKVEPEFVEKIYNHQNSELLRGLNPYHRVKTRNPANFVPNNEIESKPQEEKIWLQEVFVYDRAGVLNSIQNDLEKWQEQEAYARRWSIESTGLYETPDMQGKRSYLEKRLLKYLDKRISGEIKDAEEGSTLHKIGKVEKAVKPDTEVTFSDKFKLKLKAKVLQGEAFIFLRNPYFHYETMVNTNGTVDMKFRKELEDLKMEAAVDYHASRGYYMARVDRRLFNILTGRLSSTQDHDQPVMAGESDKRLEFFYSTNF